jgi:hypothetical protein
MRTMPKSAELSNCTPIMTQRGIGAGALRLVPGRKRLASHPCSLPSRRSLPEGWFTGRYPGAGGEAHVRGVMQACSELTYFRIYDLRSTYATRLSAGGVAEEWVTQLLWQGDAKVFKKYSQMKLQMKREALQKLNRKANEGQPGFVTVRALGPTGAVRTSVTSSRSGLKSKKLQMSGRSAAW